MPTTPTAARTAARRGKPGAAVGVRPQPLPARRPQRRPVRQPVRRAVTRRPVHRPTHRPRPRRRPVRRPGSFGGWVAQHKAVTAALACVVLLAVGGRHDVAASAAAEPASPAVAALAPAGPASAARPGPTGGACSLKDPTGGKCVTATTGHGLDELVRVFGPLHAGPTLHGAGCWDAHKWNPSSDHPKGRGCDLVPDRIGTRATGPALDHGWAVANWLRTNAAVLHVRYVIWQGRIWQADRPGDVGGWGHAYSGGGVYDPKNVTGGHWDHVHVSFQP